MYDDNVSKLSGCESLRLPVSLTSFRLRSFDVLSNVKNLGVCCPSLTTLHLSTDHNYSNSDALSSLPPTLTSVTLDSAFPSPVPLDSLRLPRLLHLSCLRTDILFSNLVVGWPDQLETLRCRLIVSSLRHLLAVPFPLSLRTFEVHLIYGEPLEVDSLAFPWQTLPSTITDLRFEGRNTPPPAEWLLGLQSLLHFHFLRKVVTYTSYENIDVIDRLNYYRHLPPTVKTFRYSIGPVFETIHRYTPMELLPELPKRLELLEIAQPSAQDESKLSPSSFASTLPLFRSLLHLELFNIGEAMCGEKLELPQGLQTLAFGLDLQTQTRPPCLLLWSLPSSLVSLDAPRHLFSPDLGAKVLPRNLTSLKCLSVAFAAACFAPHFLPPTLTELVLIVAMKVSALPLPSKELNADMCEGTLHPAKDVLPPALRRLHIQSLPSGTHSGSLYNIEPWLSTLSPTSPLESLVVEGPMLTMNKGGDFLLRLPPTLTLLHSPAINYSGKHFANLPRALTSLKLQHLDWSWLDTKVEHIPLLPPGLLELELHAANPLKSAVRSHLRHVRELNMIYKKG